MDIMQTCIPLVAVGRVQGWFYSVGGRRNLMCRSTDLIHQHAQTLLANLALERKSEERGDVPIIWVAHSLGGILVKRALELSHDLSGEMMSSPILRHLGTTVFNALRHVSYFPSIAFCGG
jgi:alpha-beta hydrolase superfamily lysophospholipase